MELARTMITLNSEQEAIRDCDASNIVVGAGAGSGKSTTMVARIAHRVRARIIRPENVWAISFSNAAAKVLTDKLEAQDIEIGYAGTLHGAGLRLLQRFGFLIGYRKGGGITILDELSRNTLLRETMDRLGYKLSMAALERGDCAKSQAVLKEYAFTLRRSSMVDYDSILTETLKLLTQHRDKLGLELDELYTDECQDHSDIDWQIIDALAARTTTVVGDDLQSIYRFRGACPELFLARATNATVLTLERNYRSDWGITKIANTLISHNRNRLPKEIIPLSENEGEIDVQPIDHSRNEASVIARHLRKWHDSGTAYVEMAVLARTNAIADELRQGLRDLNIPVAQDSALRLPADWSLCLTALQLMLDPSNNILCEQFLKGRMVPAAKVNALKMAAMKSGVSMTKLAGNDGLVPADTIDRPTNAFPMHLARMGISQESVALVHEREEALPMRHPTLSDLLSDLWQNDDWREGSEVHGVEVCTAHRSKGREFDAVVIAGCEDNVFPTRSKSSEETEERRLFFVCVTRARHKLLMTYCQKRFSYGRQVENPYSPFIDDCGLAPF